IIIEIKQRIFSICPPSQLETVVVNELKDLKEYLDKELERPQIQNKKQLVELIEKFKEVLSKEGVKAPIPTLVKALVYFDQIYHHREYDSKCALTDIRTSLNFLFHRAITVSDSNQFTLHSAYKAYKGVRDLLKEFKVKEPSLFN